MAFDPTLTVSLSRKVNVGNFESADVFISLSGIPFEASEETIGKMLKTSNLAFDMIREELRGKIAQIRREDAQDSPKRN